MHVDWAYMHIYRSYILSCLRMRQLFQFQESLRYCSQKNRMKAQQSEKSAQMGNIFSFGEKL